MQLDDPALVAARRSTSIVSACSSLSPPTYFDALTPGAAAARPIR